MDVTAVNSTKKLWALRTSLVEYLSSVKGLTLYELMAFLSTFIEFITISFESIITCF